LRERGSRDVDGEAITREMAGAGALRQLGGLECGADFGDCAVADREAGELVEDMELVHVAVEHAAGELVVGFLQTDLAFEFGPAQGGDGGGWVVLR
jgi:hypothetical protein